MHHLFEVQARKTPDAIAVAFEHQQLTYRELNLRANRVAHRLQKLRVQPDVLVALCLDRAPEMLVGILAILKAAGAYVPLDPNYPDERLDTMIYDVIVTSYGKAEVTMSAEVLEATNALRKFMFENVYLAESAKSDGAEVLLQCDGHAQIDVLLVDNLFSTDLGVKDRKLPQRIVYCLEDKWHER